MSSGSSTPNTARDERVSWRVPNDTKVQDVMDDNNSTSRSGRGTSKLASTSADKSSAKSDSGPNSPAEGRKGPKLSEVFSEASLEESKNNFGTKLWRILFGSVVSSIDELYMHCEEQGDMAKCFEVADLLKRSRVDFNKLGERIDDQSRFQLGQAMSWETRKPTLPSPMNPASGGGSTGGPTSFDIETVATSGSSTPAANSPIVTTAVPNSKAVTRSDSPLLQKSDGYDVPISIVTSPPPNKRVLNPAAKPFNPFNTAAPPVPVPMPVPAVPVSAPAVASTLSLPPTSSTSPLAKLPLKVEVPARSNSVITAGAPGLTRAVQGTATSTITTPSIFPAPPASTPSTSSKGPVATAKADIWTDELLQAEVLQATEHVWAAAEAWVEAEAEAEEQEWQLLALGINSFLKDADTLSDYESDENQRAPDLGANVKALSVSAHNSPKQFPGMGFGMGFPRELALSPEQRAIWDHTPSKGTASQSRYSGGGSPRSRGGSKAGPLHISTPTSPGGKRFTPDAPGNAAQGRSGRVARSPGNYSAFLVESTEPAERSDCPHRSPSMSPTDSFFASSVAGGGRSLHDKLSSPDRKKAISPTEMLRRYEERQINAEMNRDKTVAERIQKANVASQRLKAVEQKEAQRRIDVLKAITCKQREAADRKAQYLKQIQVKAFNESSKVNEVIYVNALNSEAIAQRLEEVETRIFAASERRQEHLHGMTLEQRRRNSRKAQHLSEWRLQFEKEKMERWEKLQQRLATVNARRTARLAELQRRAEEESRRVLGTTAATGVSLDAAPAGDEHREASEPAPVVTVPLVQVKPVTVVPSASAGAAIKSSAGPAPSTGSAALRKLAVSGNLSGKRSGRSVPRTLPPAPATGSPPGATKGPAVPAGGSGADENAGPINESEVPAKTSKSKEKRDKRKLKAQLIELAEQADISVIQEAIALNSGASGAPTITVGSASAPAAKVVAAPSGAPPAELYAQAQLLVRHCPDGCTEEGFTAWSKLAAKKANVVAKAEHAGDCAADVTKALAIFVPAGADTVDAFPPAERLLVASMRSLGAGDLLACVVNDLLAAAHKADGSSALSMHVMQRLYVLLQHVSLGGSASGGDVAADTGGVPVVPTPNLSEILLMRCLFGPEVGVLKSSAQLQTMLDALVFYQYQHVRQHTGASPPSATPQKAAVSAVTQELEVQAEVWKLVVDLLLQCSASPAGAALIIQSGLGAVLIDLLQAMLLTLEAYRKNDAHPRSMLGSELDLPHIAGAFPKFDGCFPTAVASIASALMTVLSRAVGSGPCCGANTVSIDLQTTPTCSQASVDSLVWYLSTMGQVQLLTDHLRNRAQYWQYTQSYHYRAAVLEQKECASESEGTAVDCLACSTEFYLAAADYLSSMGNFIRQSAGLALCSWHRIQHAGTQDSSAVVESILQLSPAVHRHSKGRQLVSIVRRADSVLVLVDTLSIVASCDYFAPTSSDSAAKAAYVDALLLLGKLSDAVCSLASADISLVHAVYTAEQQLLWVRTMSTVISTLQQALDGPFQSLLAGSYIGSKNSVCTTKIGLGRTHLEDSLRTLFVTVALSCLRNPALQKLCGTVIPAASSTRASKTGTCLLTALCTLSPKYYKDKKFKHCLLPCLITMCSDCDTNIHQLARQDKLAAITKYLEHSVRCYEVYTQQLQKKQAAADPAAPLVSQTEEALYVHRLSNIIPVELWNVTLVTVSRS